MADWASYLKQQDAGQGHGQQKELPSCPDDTIRTDIKIGTADISLSDDFEEDGASQT